MSQTLKVAGAAALACVGLIVTLACAVAQNHLLSQGITRGSTARSVMRAQASQPGNRRAGSATCTAVSP